MSWKDDLTDLAVAVGAEFERTVVLVPMVRPANERAKPDPARPPVETRAIFDDPEATEKLNLQEARIETREPFVSFLEADLPYDLAQGDHLLVDGARYEIGSKKRDMQDRVRYPILKVA